MPKQTFTSTQRWIVIKFDQKLCTFADKLPKHPWRWLRNAVELSPRLSRQRMYREMVLNRCTLGSTHEKPKWVINFNSRQRRGHYLTDRVHHMVAKVVHSYVSSDFTLSTEAIDKVLKDHPNVRSHFTSHSLQRWFDKYFPSSHDIMAIRTKLFADEEVVPTSDGETPDQCVEQWKAMVALFDDMKSMKEIGSNIHIANFTYVIDKIITHCENDDVRTLLARAEMIYSQDSQNSQYSQDSQNSEDSQETQNYNDFQYSQCSQGSIDSIDY